MKNPLTFAAAALLSVAFSAAHADTGLAPRSATVRYADLDINHEAGAAALYRRLKHAAEYVCRDMEPGRELGRAQDYADCIQEALGHALAQVGSGAVTAYAASHEPGVKRDAIRIARRG